MNVKREEVKNLINQDRRDNDVEQHKNTGLQELETIHANPTRKSDALQELQTKFISQTELIIIKMQLMKKKMKLNDFWRLVK